MLSTRNVFLVDAELYNLLGDEYQLNGVNGVMVFFPLMLVAFSRDYKKM